MAMYSDAFQSLRTRSGSSEARMPLPSSVEMILEYQTVKDFPDRQHRQHTRAALQIAESPIGMIRQEIFPFTEGLDMIPSKPKMNPSILKPPCIPINEQHNNQKIAFRTDQ